VSAGVERHLAFDHLYYGCVELGLGYILEVRDIERGSTNTILSPTALGEVPLVPAAIGFAIREESPRERLGNRILSSRPPVWERSLRNSVVSRSDP